MLSVSMTTLHHVDTGSTQATHCLNAAADDKRNIIVVSDVKQKTYNHHTYTHANLSYVHASTHARMHAVAICLLEISLWA